VSAAVMDRIAAFRPKSVVKLDTLLFQPTLSG
jgi:hypothetical protein